jgi:hypothetical protein
LQIYGHLKASSRAKQVFLTAKISESLPEKAKYRTESGILGDFLPEICQSPVKFT